MCLLPARCAFGRQCSCKLCSTSTPCGCRHAVFPFAFKLQKEEITVQSQVRGSGLEHLSIVLVPMIPVNEMNT